MRFKQFYLTEAVPLSAYREEIKTKLSKEYHNKYNVWFKGKFRIYIPIDKKEEQDMKPLPEIESFLKQKGYNIDSYKEGIISKPNDKNIYKIGRILNKENQPELLKKYNEHKSHIVKNEDDLLVVISRHPYDIAGMSTGRHWTSCKRLTRDENRETGLHAQYIPSEIKEGLLIAYIIKNTDKNISDPIGRVLIVPYIDLNNKDNKLLAVADKVYGSDVSGFKETVQKWVDSKQGDKKGVFVLPKTVYKDSDTGHIFSKMTDKEIEDVMGDYKFLEKMLKHNPDFIESIPEPIRVKSFDSDKKFRLLVLKYSVVDGGLIHYISNKDMDELLKTNKDIIYDILKVAEKHYEVLFYIPEDMLVDRIKTDKEFRNKFFQLMASDYQVGDSIPAEALGELFDKDKEIREDVLKYIDGNSTIILRSIPTEIVGKYFKKDKEVRDKILQVAEKLTTVLKHIPSGYLVELFNSDKEFRDKIINIARTKDRIWQNFPDNIARKYKG